MHLFALFSLVNGIFALGFGLLVIFKNWRERSNQLFFLLTLALSVWAFSYWRWLSTFDGPSALFWVRMLSVGSLLIPVFYFHWITLLLKVGERKKYLIALSYAVALAFLVFSFSPFLVKDVRPKLFFPFWPDPGILYHLYLVFIYFGLVLYSFVLLYQHFRSASREQRGQIFYIILGALFGFGGGLTNFFLWYNVPLPPYGNFFVSIFPFALGYSVLKHKLFDMKIVTTELLTFALWMFLLVRLLLAQTLEERIVDGILLVLVVFFGVLLVRSVLAEVRNRERIAELAQQLAASNEELKKLDAAKSEFISIAGHQLRAPLTVIRGYVSMFLEGVLGAVSKSEREAMAKVAISAEQLVKLVSDLLDLSRIEAGRLRYNFQPVAIGDVAGEVVKEFETSAKEKGLAFTYQNRLPAGAKVNADPDKLREVVVNFIDNAIKYTEKGKVEVTLESEDAPAGKHFAVFKVKDSGIGISPEDKERLFTKFARTEEAKRVRPDGMGLGLYIVKKIVEDHGGRVGVESSGLGKGSTFFVELPLV